MKLTFPVLLMIAMVPLILIAGFTMKLMGFPSNDVRLAVVMIGIAFLPFAFVMEHD